MGVYYKGQNYGAFYENPNKNFIKFCESKTNYTQAFANSTIKEIPEFTTNPNARNCTDMCNSSTALISFNPQFDFSQITVATQAFAGCQNLEKIPPIIDLSSCTVAVNMFYSCNKLKEIHIRNSSRVNNFQGFVRCDSGPSLLEKLETIDATSCAGFYYFFYYGDYNYLTYLRFVPNTIHVSFDFKHCPALDSDSVQSIVDGLAEVTSAQTVTFNNAITLSAQQQQDITDKGWTLAFA